MCGCATCHQTCNTRKEPSYDTTQIHSFYIGDPAFERAAMSNNDLFQMNHIAVKLYVFGSRPSNVVYSSWNKFSSRKNHVAANDVRLCVGITAGRHRHLHPRRPPVHQPVYRRSIRPRQSSPGNWLLTFYMTTSRDAAMLSELPEGENHGIFFSSLALEVSYSRHQTTTLR